MFEIHLRTTQFAIARRGNSMPGRSSHKQRPECRLVDSIRILSHCRARVSFENSFLGLG